ncbi:MAG TPA: DUF898 domain-containing protein [Nitrospiraceae bacterium]|nr:DUF898 domain-containing protein [Nitrospiraceae bacterium]
MEPDRFPQGGDSRRVGAQPPTRTGTQSAAEPKHYKPMFNGSAGEYFRIWIVNTFLTIVTLGIYAPWAKVRNRRYFYKNTLLDGHSFDYTANPVAILKGYLIIGAGVLLYYLTEAYDPRFSFIFVLLFYLMLPFLIYKSLRFFARNSTYRNIRFRFLGTLGSSFSTYLLYPILVPITLGLIIPHWAFEKKKFFFDNMAYGASRNSFHGRSGPFYKVYLLAVLTLFGSFFLGGIAVAIALRGMVDTLGNEGMRSFALMSVIVMYFVMLIVMTFFQQYIFAWETNYSWGQSRLDTVRFKSTLKATKLIWIRITNILAIIFSLGLLAPWARVRRTRYVLDNLTIISAQSLDDFTSAVEPDVGAYGDAATDLFDFEIGL